jgi:aminoglycoside phosphotransferase (APT) family kinase protein
MARASQIAELETVRVLVEQLGLGSVRPTVLRAAHRTTFLIKSLRMIAKVQTSEGLEPAQRSAARELAVARFLADQGAPVIAPLGEELSGPHVVRSAVVTLWPHVEHQRDVQEEDAVSAADALHTVHRLFRGYGGELPSYTEALDRCWKVLVDNRTSAALSRDDRLFLMAQYRRLRADVEAANLEPVPIHGDAHLGNLLLADRGPLWTDLEDACLGAPEQDIAGLPPIAWIRFQDADQRSIELWASMKSVCVAVWCWADISRSAEVREAAEYHLRRLRGLAL